MDDSGRPNLAVNLWPGVSFSDLSVPAQREQWDRLIGWAFFFFGIPALYIISSLSLVFPATAIDHRPSLAWSWQATEGNGWRMFVTVGALPWALSLLIWSLYRDGATDIEYIFLTAVYVMATVFEVAALSLSYKDLVEGDLSRDKIVMEI